MGDHPHAAKAEHLHELLSLGVAEDKGTVHDEKDAVVVGDRQAGRDFLSGGRHRSE